MSSQEPVFLAQSSDVRLLSNVLRPLQSLSPHVICEIRPSSLTFIVFPNPDFWVRVWIHPYWFTTYVCTTAAGDTDTASEPTPLAPNQAKDETLAREAQTLGREGLPTHKIGLDLRLLLECLEVFGGPSWGVNVADQDKGGGKPRSSKTALPDVFNDRKTTLRTAFKLSLLEDAEAVNLILEENEVVAHCSLTMSVVDESDCPAFHMHPDKSARMITDSDWLGAVLQSIHPSCEQVKISFKPQREHSTGEFRLEAETDVGKVQAVLRSDASNVFNYHCQWTGSGPHTYGFGAFTHLVRALNSSSKISLSVDRLGHLGAHCVVPVSMTVWEEAQQATTSRLPSIIYTIAPKDNDDE